jgi:hypothetical protein
MTMTSPAEALANQLTNKVIVDPDIEPADIDRYFVTARAVIADLVAHGFTVTPPVDLGVDSAPEAILDAAGIDPVAKPIHAIKALRDTPGWKLGLKGSKDVVDQIAARRVAAWVVQHESFPEWPERARNAAAAHFGVMVNGCALDRAMAIAQANEAVR